MELIKEADFRREIKSNPRTGYLFFGDEDYLKAFAVKSAREALCPDPSFSFFNEMKLDATDFTPQKLLDAMMPLPMMADRKLITVGGLNFNTLRPSDLDALCEVLSFLPEYDFNVLILNVAADCLNPGFLPKRPSAVLERLSELLTPVQFERCPPARLSAWVGKHLSHNGVEAGPGVCALIIEYCGRSMYILANEIDKLSFYVRSHNRTVATAEDVKKVCTPATEYDAFAFTNAIMAGQQDTALAILADYRFRRVEPLMILGDVTRVFCDMIAIQSLTDQGVPDSSIAAALKMHEYKVGLYRKSLRQTDRNRLKRALNACAVADASLKLSPQGFTALERLICSI